MSVDTGILYAHPDGRLGDPRTGATVSTWNPGGGDSFTLKVTRPTPANTFQHYAKHVANDDSWVTETINAAREIVIDTPGVYENRRYNAYIRINAGAATPQNPIIFRANDVRGPLDPDENNGHPMIYVLGSTHPDAVIIERNRFVTTVYYNEVDGFRSGGNVTFRRNWVEQTVDGSPLIFGGNVVEGNYLRGGARIPQPGQIDGWTHNDGIQVQGGANQRLVGNDIAGFTNGGIYVEAENPGTYGAITNLLIDGNWINDGATGIHIFKQSADVALSATVTGNRFGPNAGQDAAHRMWIGNTVTLTASGNVLEDGTPISPTLVNMG